MRNTQTRFGELETEKRAKKFREEMGNTRSLTAEKQP